MCFDLQGFLKHAFFYVQMATKKFTDSQRVCSVGLSQDCFWYLTVSAQKNIPWVPKQAFTWYDNTWVLQACVFFSVGWGILRI